jgi:hypothetical protein
LGLVILEKLKLRFRAGCNPSYKGGRGRRIEIQAGPEQKLETLSEK